MPLPLFLRKVLERRGSDLDSAKCRRNHDFYKKKRYFARERPLNVESFFAIIYIVKFWSGVTVFLGGNLL